MSSARIAGLALALCSSSLGSPVAAQESDYYRIDYLTPPTGEVLEVGGLDFFSDGRLAVSTRRGQVWIIENPLAEDPAEAEFTLFAEGLFEGLGLAIVHDELFVLQRTELSRLRDVDGDGVCDEIDCISNDWGFSGNYHEYAFGLPVDEQGNFYLSLNVGFFEPEWWHGKAVVKDRGWLLKVAPDGTTTPFAFGMRSPCGLGFDTKGRLFYSDNQGDWMAACAIFHAQYARFYGHPAALTWSRAYLESQTVASSTIPPEKYHESAACWIPYEWSRSTGSLVPDDTGGKFGPFGEQMVIAELTKGKLLRASFENVRGEQQGAVFPLLSGVGSAIRVKFASDGTLFTGLTNRGWGGLAPGQGIGRVRWTGETPFEMKSVKLQNDGLMIFFTKPLDPEHLPDVSSFSLYDYDYDYWWEYGSPERDHRELVVQRLELDAEGTRLQLWFEGLKAGRVLRLRASGLQAADGTPLLHEEFAYTINQLPGGRISRVRVAKTVPPPPARSSGEEGWLRLTYGDALDVWRSEGWELCDVELDPAKPTRFKITKGVGALTNTAGDKPSEYVSKQEFGDVQVRLAFMLPEGGNSGLYLMGRYELQWRDSAGVRELRSSDCGGLYAGATWPGAAPLQNAYRGPGQWHALDITFRAPRFDESGKKLTNARFESVLIDGVLVQEEVEVPEPTLGAWPGEVARAALRIQGDHGPVAIGDIRVRPLAVAPEGLAPESEGQAWHSLFAEEGLEGWAILGAPSWSLEDGELSSDGEASTLHTTAELPANFELRARLKISDGGRSALVLRGQQASGALEGETLQGYEVIVNSSFPDQQKTGSLTGLATIKTHLIPPDTWFDLRVACADEERGTRLSVWLNDVLVSEVLDEERRFTSGAIGLVQHHDGSIVEVSRLELRSLE